MLKDKKNSYATKWRKSFNNGIIMPTKMRQCNKCKDGILCTTCNNLIDEDKEFKANLYLLKRDVPNQFGHTLPYYII